VLEEGSVWVGSLEVFVRNSLRTLKEFGLVKREADQWKILNTFTYISLPISNRKSRELSGKFSRPIEPEVQPRHKCLRFLTTKLLLGYVHLPYIDLGIGKGRGSERDVHFLNRKLSISEKMQIDLSMATTITLMTSI